MQKRTHLLRTRRYVKKRAYIVFSTYTFFYFRPLFLFRLLLLPLSSVFSFSSAFFSHSARWTNRKNDRIGKQIHMMYRVWRHFVSLRIFPDEHAEKDTDLSWFRFASSATISFVCYPSFERLWVSATETDIDLIRNRNHLFRPLRSSTRDAFIRQGLINRYLRSLLQDSIKSIS